MTSAHDIIETVKEGDRYVPRLQQGGSLVSPTSVVGGEDFVQQLAATLSAGGAGGALSFDDQVKLEQLRQRGDISIASIGARAQELIARLREAGETGRTQFTTEAGARAGAQAAALDIVKSIQDALKEQGFVAPGVAATADPNAARLALIEALREGTVFPTPAREQLLAQVAAQPSDIVRLLALSAGKSALSPAETELRGELQFNLPKTVAEGASARGRLAGQLEHLPPITFQDLLDRYLPLVEKPPDIAGQIGAAISAALAGVGGPAAPAPAPAPAPTTSSSLSARDRFRQVEQRLQPSGRRTPATSPTAQRTPVRPDRPFTNASSDGMFRDTAAAIRDGLKAPNAAAVQTVFEGRRRQLARLAQTANLTDLQNFLDAIVEERRLAGFGRSVYVTTTEMRDRLFSRLDQVIADITSILDARRGLRRRAEGGRVFEPGFFLVGDKGDGIARGTAEFASLAAGSVIAPMKTGEKPTMSNARRAVAEMLIFGRRAKDGEKVPHLSHGGVTVRAGDSLWEIIRRLGGNPTRWPEVARAIGLSDPRRLQIGTVIPFEVLQAVGANVPVPPTPAQIPASTPTPTPNATPAPAPVAPGPEERIQQKTRTGLETFLGPGGTVASILRGGRSLAEILAGFNLAPEGGFTGLRIDPELLRLFRGPATKFPLQTFEELPTATQQAVSSLIGTFTGDQNILGAILGLQRGLRQRAFAGNEQLALTR